MATKSSNLSSLLPIARVSFFANDENEHFVCWSEADTCWKLSNNSGEVKKCYHLCDALTAMHWQTAQNLHGDEYRDRVVQKWEVGQD